MAADSCEYLTTQLIIPEECNTTSVNSNNHELSYRKCIWKPHAMSGASLVRAEGFHVNVIILSEVFQQQPDTVSGAVQLFF